ncbi:MAG: hypothetical protein NC299_01245 [Lachnospiraceae bacterium]|nr:hypothetical protein [Ruminococcus sp.]MCM1273974.1 hypothetical protein [Lachnospiraceae bacterium]
MDLRKKVSGKARSRRAMLRGAARWGLYAAALLVFYLFECNPLIRGYCPLLLIPLATAVAMYEGDLAAGVFGVFCGLMLDIANGVTVAGFSSLWLLCACPLISLMSRFWIKVTFISHFIVNAAVSVIMAAMDFLFLHCMWEGADSVISFTGVILPSYGGAVFYSIPVYFLITLIVNKLRPKEQRRLEESAQSAEESEFKEKD